MILAAGKGTRLKSELPKALHRVAGQPMLAHLLDAVERLAPARTVVVAGYKFSDVKRFVGRRASVARQARQLGSGHAVMAAERALNGFHGTTLVLYCDTPAVTTRTLEKLLEVKRDRGSDCALLSSEMDDPTGYGRVKRAPDGRVTGIVEETDAAADEKSIREINVGGYAFDSKSLFGALKRVRPNEKKGEIYLTDAVGILCGEGRVDALVVEDADETRGANTRAELAALGGIVQDKILERLAEGGVEIRDPRTVTIDADVKIGAGTRILPHTVIEEGSVIGKDCVIGPFARIRGGSKIGDRAVIGNFVEIVRTTIGRGSQVKHLSYLGDAVVGEGVNVGAGTVTANYDGRAKHRTVIRDGARIGSGTVLIAPVTVGRLAVTGAGAVVPKGKNVPDRTTVVGVPAEPLVKRGQKAKRKKW